MGRQAYRRLNGAPVFLAPTEKVLRSPKAEDDVYGICPPGCVVQLLPGPERRLFWKPGRGRLHPRGSVCGGIRKTGKFLMFTCGSVGVCVWGHKTPVWGRVTFPTWRLTAFCPESQETCGRGREGNYHLSHTCSQATSHSSVTSLDGLGVLQAALFPAGYLSPRGNRLLCRQGARGPGSEGPESHRDPVGPGGKAPCQNGQPGAGGTALCWEAVPAHASWTQSRAGVRMHRAQQDLDPHGLTSSPVSANFGHDSHACPLL